MIFIFEWISIEFFDIINNSINEIDERLYTWRFGQKTWKMVGIDVQIIAREFVI